jgi:hypothetical protein
MVCRREAKAWEFAVRRYEPLTPRATHLLELLKAIVLTYIAVLHDVSHGSENPRVRWRFLRHVAVDPGMFCFAQPVSLHWLRFTVTGKVTAECIIIRDKL